MEKKMKILVETTGTFSLLDPVSRMEIKKNRVNVVNRTGFVVNHIGFNNLDPLGNVNTDATQEEWEKYVEEYTDEKGVFDKDLAVQVFLEQFKVGAEEPKPEPTEEPKPEPTEEPKQTKPRAKKVNK